MATTLGTHCVVGTGVHCNNMLKHIYLFIYLLLLLLLLLLFEYCFLFLHIPSCELTILKAMRIAIDTFQLIRALWSGTSPFLDVFYSILLILQAKKALIRLRELDCAVHKRVDVTFSLGLLKVKVDCSVNLYHCLDKFSRWQTDIFLNFPRK